jgi:hypothetical protein
VGCNRPAAVACDLVHDGLDLLGCEPLVVRLVVRTSHTTGGTDLDDICALPQESSYSNPAVPATLNPDGSAPRSRAVVMPASSVRPHALGRLEGGNRGIVEEPRDELGGGLDTEMDVARRFDVDDCSMERSSPCPVDERDVVDTERLFMGAAVHAGPFPGPVMSVV